MKNDKNVYDFVKVDTQSFIDMCSKIEQLEQDKKILGNELTYFKEYAADLEEEVNALKHRCKQLAVRNNELELEVKDMRFTRKYLTSEEAGKRFAQELLGGI